MKAIEDNELKSSGWDYSTEMTDEFEQLVKVALEKIMPHNTTETNPYTTYFRIKGKDINDYDCCNDPKCIKKAKKAIHEHYGKGIHIEECQSANDGDHERIEICTICGSPFNEWLTWCIDELKYIEGEKPWTKEFIIDEAFTIQAILQSQPTMDERISRYHGRQGGDILKEALADREAFFQRIVELSNSVINLL